ncbi:hypothetical protein AVDCRST_MAG92-2185 [uncultured Coleofasciculus sp.]|uniref:Uncharacterized protein n=1 Tax=uncultured Coleofasciculus sp. TaxID=1267456 RepID=A0A6J4INX2_9CYAN|nr:hypothetical protein AVDCRST_MAG92-2185 [uncultured Coleofasciculus sp.]
MLNRERGSKDAICASLSLAGGISLPQNIAWVESELWAFLVDVLKTVAK